MRLAALYTIVFEMNKQKALTKCRGALLCGVGLTKGELYVPTSYKVMSNIRYFLAQVFK